MTDSQPNEILAKLLDADNIEKNSEDVMRFFNEGGNFEQILGLTEKEMATRYSYAFDRFDQGLYKDALEIFSYLSILNPMKKKYWLAMAATRVRMQDLEGALHQYAIVSILDADDPEPHYYSAFCYIGLHQKEEAIKSLKQVMNIAKRLDRYQELGKKAELALNQI